MRETIMGSKPSEKVVATHEVFGVRFDINRTVWQDGSLSFDIHEAATFFSLHDLSFDEEPGVQQIEDRIEHLSRCHDDNDYLSDASFFDHDEVGAFLARLKRPSNVTVRWAIVSGIDNTVVHEGSSDVYARSLKSAGEQAVELARDSVYYDDRIQPRVMIIEFEGDDLSDQ